MRSDPSASALAFRRGQIDSLARTHLDADGIYTPDLRHALALRLLSRAWAQYREDRAIALGGRFAGGECTAERDAFLVLLERILPPHEAWLSNAIRSVRRIAVIPLAAEARQTADLITGSAPELDAVAQTLASAKLPDDPIERLLAVLSHHRYSRSLEHDPLSATANSPCWAVNLLAVARPEAFGLCPVPLPCPGIVRRRLFRADLDPARRRASALEFLLEALHEVARDIDRIRRARRCFDAAFTQLRSNSRLGSAWLLMVGLGDLTPAQLARALPATKAGAGKLLRQLETAHLVRSSGPFEPYYCNPIATASFVDM